MIVLLLIIVGVFLIAAISLVVAIRIDCDIRLAFLERFGKSISCLRGKVIFITGASSGIGEYTAYAFAKHGVRLILAARRRTELERVKNKCVDVSNGRLTDDDILVIVMDMCELDEHKMHFDHAVRHFGHVDVLLSNAGRSQRAEWEHIDIAVDKEVFELNVFSVIHLTRIALAHFRQMGSGHVAVTSSIAGIVAVPNSASYTGAKHALHGYINSLRNEISETGINVTILCPGPTYTNFLAASFTGRTGELHGIAAESTDKRMTAERCGQLCALSIANQVHEAWIAVFPILPITYCYVYYPLIFQTIANIIGPQRFFKLRDNRKDS